MDDSALPPLLGIIGHPIAGNPTHFAMEQAIRAAQLDWRFLSFDVTPDDLPAAIEGARVLGFKGLAIAPPFTDKVTQLISHTSGRAQQSGWIDTLVRNADGVLVGHHLLADSLAMLIGPERLASARIAVLGNSAKTQALARSLQSDDSVQVEVHASESLFEEAAAIAEFTVLIRGVEVLVGKSSTDERPAPFDESNVDQLSNQCVVIDLAVSASTSPLLRFASARGMVTFSLIDLLVSRAALAFQLWTGVDADQVRLREAFEEYLEI